MAKPFYSGGFLYDPNSKRILLHKRDRKTENNPDSWAFFGGLSKDNETPIKTFKRELREELELKVSDDAIQKLTDYFNPDFDTHRYVFYALVAEVRNLKLHEGEGYAWFTLKEAFNKNLTKRTGQDLALFQKQLP